MTREKLVWQATDMNQRGQMLVQMLVSVGIMAIMVAIFAAMLSNQQKEMKSLNEVLASMDLQKTTIAALADGSVCLYMLNNPSSLTFDSTQVSSLTPQKLIPVVPLYASVTPTLGPVVSRVDELASVYSNTLFVKEIYLSISGAPTPLPTPGPGKSFLGNWVITFDPNKTVRAVKPITVSTTLTVDTTIPTSAFVTGCMTNTGAVDGLCGTANAQQFGSAPLNNLCASGPSSGLVGTGPWNWTCYGLNGGSSQNCSATKLLNDFSHYCSSEDQWCYAPPGFVVKLPCSGQTATVPASGRICCNVWSDHAYGCNAEGGGTPFGSDLCYGTVKVCYY